MSGWFLCSKRSAFDPVSGLSLKLTLYRSMGLLITYMQQFPNLNVHGNDQCCFKVQITSPKFESLIQIVFLTSFQVILTQAVPKPNSEIHCAHRTLQAWGAELLAQRISGPPLIVASSYIPGAGPGTYTPLLCDWVWTTTSGRLPKKKGVVPGETLQGPLRQSGSQIWWLIENHLENFLHLNSQTSGH